jgi:MFS family permease
MKRLRWYDYLSINLFWLGLNIRNTAVGSIFMPYLVERYASPDWKNTALSAMSTAGLIIAMLIQPAAGLVSDRSTSRYGRRRPFILTGTLLDLLFLAAIGLSWNYWSLLVAVLLIQFSANVSHGPLQGLIPDLVPEDQRGRASAIKALFELLPIFLVGITIAVMVSAGHLGWAIIATGGGLLITALVTIFTVKEQPLKEKPDIPFWPPMVRVFGMLAGIIFGGLAGLLGGELIGGIAGLITWLFAGQAIATTVAVGLGGAVAMIIAVVIGVWAGSIATLSKGTGIIRGTFLGLLCGGLLGGMVYFGAFTLVANYAAIAIGLNAGGILAILIAAGSGIRANSKEKVGEEASHHASFIWWIVNRLFFLAAITSLQRFALYFLMYAFKINVDQATALFGRLITILGVFILLSAFIAGWLADRFSHTLLVGLSGFLAALGGIVLLGTIWMPSEGLIYVAGTILGAATGLFMTTNWAMGTNLVPPAEAGRFLGISNLAGAGAGMIGGSIGGPIADYLNLGTPGLGYFAIIAAYVVLFVLSSVSLKFIRTQQSATPAMHDDHTQLALSKP